MSPSATGSTGTPHPATAIHLSAPAATSPTVPPPSNISAVEERMRAEVPALEQRLEAMIDRVIDARFAEFRKEMIGVVDEMLKAVGRA